MEHIVAGVSPLGAGVKQRTPAAAGSFQPGEVVAGQSWGSGMCTASRKIPSQRSIPQELGHAITHCLPIMVHNRSRGHDELLTRVNLAVP